MASKSLDDLYKEIAPKVGHDTFMAELKKADAWVTELTELVIAANAWGEKNNYPVVDSYPQCVRARIIGSELAARGGGMKLMHTVYRSVKKRLDQKGLHEYNLSLLEFGWSGIGGWQP